MKRAFTASTLLVVLMLAVVAGCGSSTDLSRAETQRQFGVRMAKMNLWREAMFRFKRAVEIDPNDAQAHNNLAVAYEATGDFDAAAREYREALRLDRSNQHIQKNYSRFVEFTSRSKKRQQPARTASTSTAPATPTTVTAATGGEPVVYTPPPVTTGTGEPPVITSPPVTDTSATSPAPPTNTAPPPPPTGGLL
ncbi:MAG TPA: tetratricopeptide repeat protein [Vicinamibacterales bacterium]|nr:tetratricopeptide repeat protein [Vicinamibacterales bacterium]